MYNIKKTIPDLLPPEEIYAGIPAVFRLTVRNNKRHLPSFLIRAESSNGHAVVFPVLSQRSLHFASILITFNRRGETQLGRITISSPYPVGFFTRFWSYDSNRTITVFPRPIASSLHGSGDESPAAGSGLRRDRGLSGELERIYPYSGSEPLRMIHWKHSARSLDFLVKGFGRSVAAPLLIDIDDLAGRGVEERLSHAAWLIQRWVRERPVGLVLGGRVLPSAVGTRHGRMLLKELALYDSH